MTISENTTNMIFDRVTISDQNRALIQNLNLEIEPGQIVTLMGPSGSGKSTLLAFVAGFLSPYFQSSGAVKLNAVQLNTLPAEKRRVGLLFQDDLLLPHLNVHQNLMFGIQPKDTLGNKRTTQQKSDMIEKALKAASLDGYQKKRPQTLSGGQKARVALIRTLLSEPKALLLDEPFSKLDARLRRSFREYVKSQIQERQLPTLLVTHDEEDAKAMGGPIVIIGEEGHLSRA